MNYNDENIFLLGPIDDNVEGNIVLPLIRQIQKQRMYRDGQIDFYINSPGGYAHTCFQIVSLMNHAKREGITVRTIVQDMAASAGSIIAVAGTPGERYIDKSASHMVHYGGGMTHLSSPDSLERVAGEFTYFFDKVYKHYRQNASVPDLKRKMQIDNLNIPAKDCVAWGLADKYTDKLDIGYSE